MKNLGLKQTFAIVLGAILVAIQLVGVTAFAMAPSDNEDRMRAVNRALEQSLSERAKSHSRYERNMAASRIRDSAMMQKQKQDEVSEEPANDHLILRGDSRLSDDSRETRAQNRVSNRAQSKLEIRESMEQVRREKRLNWLND